jgi:hypothetical protein
MSCEHLICAACAGPVAEGNCPVCQSARAHVHHHGSALRMPLIVVTLAALLILLAMHLAQ